MWGFGLALSNAMLLQDSLEDQVNGDSTIECTYVDENLLCDENHRGPFFKVRRAVLCNDWLCATNMNTVGWMFVCGSGRLYHQFSFKIII